MRTSFDAAVQGVELEGLSAITVDCHRQCFSVKVASGYDGKRLAK
jgi:hypothetical protein